MEMLCEDTLMMICKTLISKSSFQLLMVDKYLRALMQKQISKEIETVTHISSLNLHNLCLRASTCLPLIKLQKCTQRNRLVTYSGERIRSNTRFVLAQWNHLDSSRCLLLSKKRVNSIMFSYPSRGAIWDLDLKDNFRKPPDTLFFIRSPMPLTSHSSHHL